MHDTKQKIHELGPLLIVFFALFSLFIVLTKLEALSVPFYWDETIYFIRSLFENGLSSLSPSQYVPSQWHGHPPLFQLFHYFLYQITGKVELSGHIAAMISFLFFLYCVFRAALKSGSPLFSITLILCLFNIPHFFSYSTQLFPNFLMLGMGISAISSYCEENYPKTAIYLCLCFLTRESGLAFATPLVFHAIFIRKLSLNKLLFIIVPTLILFSFLGYNTYVNNSFVNHPYVTSRIKNGFELFSIENKSFESVLSALGHSTFTFWRPTFFYSLPILIVGIFSLKKVRAFFSLSTFEMLFAFVCLEFLVFFTLYDDTIPRDFLIITVFFMGSYLRAIDLIASSPKIKFIAFLVFFIFFFKSIRWFHYNYSANDLTQHAYEVRSKELRKLIDHISRSYCLTNQPKYFGPWPFAESLRIYDTITQEVSLRCKESLKEFDLLINSNLLSVSGEKLFKKYRIGPNWAKVYDRRVSLNESEEFFTEVYIRKGMNNDKE